MLIDLVIGGLSGVISRTLTAPLEFRPPELNVGSFPPEAIASADAD